MALLDLAGKLSSSHDAKDTPSENKNATIAESIPVKVTQALNAFELAAKNDAEKLKKSVENWYNSAMDRASGWYKRRSQWIILGFGLAISVALNVDCVQIARRLSDDAALRQGLVAAAQATASAQSTNQNADAKSAIEQDLNKLNSLGLPIGWPNRDFSKTSNQSSI